MADYWKSQAKKFCDFCKCWIADNKPSIGFHERGKRHQENVEQRLNQLRKRGIEEYNAEQAMASDLQQMEEAALKAYEKDVALNRDLTSQLYNESQRSARNSIEQDSGRCEQSANKQSFRKTDDKEESKQESVKSKAENEPDDSDVNNVKVWYEAKTDDGFTYYWNLETGESRWDTPEEGFMSIAKQEEIYKQQKEAADKKEESEILATLVDKEEAGTNKEHDQNEEEDEESEEKEEINEKEESEEEQLGNKIGPARKPDPYGGWKTVKKKKAKTVDLQLPVQEFVEYKVPALSMEPSLKFKEKTFTSLCTSADGNVNVGFRKRKFAGEHKRNIRRRDGDD